MAAYTHIYGPASRRILTGLVGISFPSAIARPLLQLLGHTVAADARIGFSWLGVRSLCLGPGTRIGHFNVFSCRLLVLCEGACIGHMNHTRGPLAVLLAKRASLGNRNRIVRAPLGSVTIGNAVLRLGTLTKLTSGHYIDCTRSVRVGAYSILAGADSQIWTHGYVHEPTGPGRYRIDGEVRLGSNVYIGSRCVVTAGVRIADGAMVGAGTTVARDLPDAALYVAGPLRVLPRPAAPQSRADLRLEGGTELQETVYCKTR